jgi:hypothetical protein
MQSPFVSPSIAGRPAEAGLGSRGISRAARWAYPRSGIHLAWGVPSGVEGV